MAFLDKVREVLTKTKVKKVENVRVVKNPAKLELKKRSRIVKKTMKRSSHGVHRSLAKRYGKRTNPA